MIIRNKIAMDIIRKRATAIELQEPVRRIRRKAKKLKLKLSTIAVYVSVFALIVVIVFTSYQVPKDSSTVINALDISTPSVDDVVATSVAANVAIAANLPIANNIANLAISTQAKSELSLNGNVSSTRYKNIGSSVAGRSIVSYQVVSGDTLDSISSRFGISVDTIKWANNLQYDTISAGKVLQILPIDGVIYTVKYGDTLDSIAERYSVNKERLVLYNDLDVSGLIPETQVILPNAVLPDDEMPGYISYYSSGAIGNRYDWGNCTWYAYERRLQMGIPVQSLWGNANTWAYFAKLSGYLVDYNPTVGAVMVDTSGWYGHVAVVERKADNGDIVISEMNYEGFNVVSSRTITAGQAANYQYIH